MGPSQACPPESLVFQFFFSFFQFFQLFSVFFSIFRFCVQFFSVFQFSSVFTFITPLVCSEYSPRIALVP